MNIYQKLQRCRAELKNVKIKESGNNKFAGYTYMELGDFLPHIVSLCDTHGLCTLVSFGDTAATLTIINSEAPEESVVISSPMSTASLKGCHEIQNLGAVETYLRRYLYVTAFEIVEHDALDSSTGKSDSQQAHKETRPVPKISIDQALVIRDTLTQCKYAEADFLKFAGIKTLEQMDVTRYEGALKHINARAARELQPA